MKPEPNRPAAPDTLGARAVPAYSTAIWNHPTPKAWVLYDADCPVCTKFALRFKNLLARRAFAILPLQTSWVRTRFNELNDIDYLAEMRLLFPDGKKFGGADALIELARHYWWAWPLFAFGHVPPFHALMRAGYRWFARRRGCTTTCNAKPHHRHHGVTSFFEMP